MSTVTIYIDTETDMSKSPAQVAYETFAASFGIDTPQLRKAKPPINGPMPWEDLPEGEKKRWQMAFAAGLEHDRLIRAAESLVLLKQMTAPLDKVNGKPHVVDTTGEKKHA